MVSAGGVELVGHRGWMLDQTEAAILLACRQPPCTNASLMPIFSRELRCDGISTYSSANVGLRLRAIEPNVIYTFPNPDGTRIDRVAVRDLSCRVHLPTFGVPQIKTEKAIAPKLPHSSPLVQCPEPTVGLDPALPSKPRNLGRLAEICQPTEAPTTSEPMALEL